MRIKDRHGAYRTLFFSKTGSTSIIGQMFPSFDHLTYRPYKGAKRGWYYRLPWNKKKFGNDVK